MLLSPDRFTLLLTYGKDGVPDLSTLSQKEPAHLKLSYKEPFEQFTGIMMLQLCLRKALLRGSFDTVVIDISQWADHQDEDYFHIFCKYLHDHTLNKKLYFTISQKEQYCKDKLFFALRDYLPGDQKEDRTLIDAALLKEYLHCQVSISSEAAAHLSELIAEESCGELCSYLKIYDLLTELQAAADGKKITQKTINDYLVTDYNLLELHLPHKALEVLKKEDHIA